MVLVLGLINNRLGEGKGGRGREEGRKKGRKEGGEEKDIIKLFEYMISQIWVLLILLIAVRSVSWRN